MAAAACLLAAAALWAGAPGAGAETIEEAFLAAPSAQGAAAHLKRLTSEPHVAGTPGDFRMAEYVRSQLEDLGFEAVIEPVKVLLNYPTDAPYLATVEEDKAEEPLDIAERVLDKDATSDVPDRNHTFHGYAPAGDVTGEFVYANFGRPEDFDALEELNVSVAGKIAIMRYGRCFRGLKVWNAQRLGAIGALIYSDPHEDGTTQGDVYPNGPWRPPFGVQRGSVQFNSLCGGDPSRAAGPASPEEICGLSQQDLIPNITSLPIGYGPAAELLARLGGPTPKGFKGGLANLSYAVGPSSIKLRLRTSTKFVTTPIPNVIARLRGAEDRAVIVGNHRDAWVFGAADPNSGTATMLEVARGLGRLASRGWRPRRTLVLASWSGEEYGLVGSTAWAELHAEEMPKTYAYLNVDTAVSGNYLVGGGSFALQDAFADVLRLVSTPAGPLSQSWSHKWEVLGSGSDYSVFLDHFGVASVDFDFTRTDSTGSPTSYGQYHSIYDSFDWMKNFGGMAPGESFEYMRSAAQVWGLLALRLADREVVPFNHSRQAEAMAQWADDLPPGLDLGSLRAGIAAYAAAAEAAARQTRAGAHADLNDRLAFTERAFLFEKGLPGRKWYRHTLQAPGIELGYGSVTFPGVTEAMQSGQKALAKEQLAILARTVRRAAAYLGGEARGAARGDETGQGVLVV
mmetsp:Transcript_99081/g.296049  ORF Transcript_99081/g.296049 Transcript_99081/m.296049 type:complete len:683 (+) Transcript_99081:59-2107(+)